MADDRIGGLELFKDFPRRIVRLRGDTTIAGAARERIKANTLAKDGLFVVVCRLRKASTCSSRSGAIAA
jgi:hypothetical protein